MKEEDRETVALDVDRALKAHERQTPHLLAMHCPSCGHMAPFWKDRDKFFSSLLPNSHGYDMDMLERTCNIFTCLGCGKSFRRTQKQVSELIELPDPKSED